MLPGNLPRPLLSLLFEPVAKIQDSDEEALGGLWSIVTKVSDAMSDGKRLENMSWRLWYRAYSRKAIAMIHSTENGRASSESRIRGSSSLTPSLSFSSSSEATSNSSDWDRDTTVGDDEDALPNRNNNNAPGQPNSAISPCLKNGRLTSNNNSLTVLPTRAGPAPSTASTPSSNLSHVNVDDDGREIPTPSPFDDSSPHLVQDAADAGSRPTNPQTQGNASPVSYQGSIDLSQSNATDHVCRTSLSPHKDRLGPPGPSISTELLPLVTGTTAANPKSSTVGKLILRMLAEKVTFAKPTGQRKPGNETIIASERKNSCPSPRVHIIAPPESPPSNANSTLTSAASTPRQTFPTVVVVNPTPHPTPPATPSIEASDKTFDLPPNAAAAVLPPRLALDANIAGTSLSPPGNNTQLATPVSLGKHSVSLNDHVTPEQIPSQRPSSFLVPQSVTFAAPTSTSLSSRLSLASNSIALPDRPTSSMEIASHLPTPAAESTPDMTNGTSRATTAPIQAPVPVISEDKKFFLAVPHRGSGGSGHDSTESPDSFGTGSTNSRRRDTARGSPLIDLRDSYSRSQASSRPEEAVSSSFSASSPAGRAPSITSSRGGVGGAFRPKSRATFTVAGSSGKRKGASKKSAKDLYKRQSEKRLSVENASVDESNLKGKGKAGLIERNDGTPPMLPAALRMTNVTAQIPRVKTMHHLNGLNQNLQNQLNLRQLPTNPPRRPVSPPPQPPIDKRGHVTNGATTRVPHTGQQGQGKSQQLGQLDIGPLLPPVPAKSGRPIEIAETSSDYSTTDTEDDSWESDSGSVDDKSNGQGSRSRRSDASKGERLRHSNNRQRDPGESVRDAALEAQRQRDMFQKLPSKTYSNMSQLPRTKSGISLLFRPDPELFPVGHPYRTSRSSQDLLARNWSAPTPPLAMTAIQRSTPVAPVKADVTASSVTSKIMDEATATTTGPVTRRSSATQAQPNGGKYRPRAKPADQEEESDSDDPEDIPIPHSVAERRLEALMKRGSRVQANTPSTLPKEPECSNANTEGQIQADNPQTIPRTTTMPVLPHQFLPEPAPLQLPHEIRRWIISRELDEELRRNLLWERSQNQIPGRPPRLNGSILTGPWKSLTPNKPTNPDEPQSPQRPTKPKVRVQAQDKEDSSTSRLFSTQRTKSWAGEYHATGW